MSTAAEIVAEVDRLHHSNQQREAYEYLNPHCDEATDCEILWRLLRAFYRVGKYLSKNTAEQDYIAQKGLQILERAVRDYEDDFNVQKWAGIFLSWQSQHIGMKCKIEKSFDIKKHFERAIAINGSDAEVKHTLGRWCYEVASVGWMARKIAQAAFASPPESSYDEALRYFLDAEETSPGFYSGNWLYLGKTYYQLKQYAEAKKWLEKLIESSPKTVDGKEYMAEAVKLIKKV